MKAHMTHKRNLRFKIRKQVFKYKLFQKPYAWMSLKCFVGSYPFFWMAKWRSYFLMNKNPYAVVWIIPRGKPTKRFFRKMEKFRNVVKNWKHNPWADYPD